MFGFIIKKLREGRDFSQEYMAANLNISQAAYSKLESDKTALSIKNLFEICRILGIKETDILNSYKDKADCAVIDLRTGTATAGQDDYINTLKKLIEVYEKENQLLKNTNERLFHILELDKTKNAG